MAAPFRCSLTTPAISPSRRLPLAKTTSSLDSGLLGLRLVAESKPPPDARLSVYDINPGALVWIDFVLSNAHRLRTFPDLVETFRSEHPDLAIREVAPHERENAGKQERWYHERRADLAALGKLERAMVQVDVLTSPSALFRLLRPGRRTMVMYLDLFVPWNIARHLALGLRRARYRAFVRDGGKGHRAIPGPLCAQRQNAGISYRSGVSLSCTGWRSSVYVNPFWSYRRVAEAVAITNHLTGATEPFPADVIETIVAAGASDDVAADAGTVARLRDMNVLFDDRNSAITWFAEVERTAQVARPIVDQIELTNRCPYSCKMCPRTSSMSRSLGDMDFELFARICEQISGNQQYVALHHFGELLLHRQLPDMVRHATRKNLRDRAFMQPAFPESRAGGASARCGNCQPGAFVRFPRSGELP